MFRRTAESLPETVGRRCPRICGHAVIRGSIIPDYYPPIATAFRLRTKRPYLEYAR